MLSDVWLLEMRDSVWQWHEINVRNVQWAASHIWCNPASKIGDIVVVLSRNPKMAPEFSYSKWVPNPPHQRSADRLQLDVEYVPNSIRR